MGRPGWRLGGRRYHLVGATPGRWARRHPPQSSDHVSTASRGNAESRRESLDRATRRVRQDLVWLRKDPSNQAADDRLRVDRFSGRPSRLDLRKVRRLDREQSRSRKRSDARRHAQQHQSVLVDVDRDLLRAALRRKLLHGFLDPEAGLPCSRKRLPRRVYRPLKLWAERIYAQLFYWNETSKGGHFAAFEQPGIFVAELRQA